MSDTDDAVDDSPAAAPRGPRTILSCTLLGAAEGAAVAAGAFVAAGAALQGAWLDAPLAWAGAIALGAIVGACVALRRRSGPAPKRPRSRAQLEPALPAAWLQVVSGASREVLEATLTEMAARCLARGERVLVIDGGRATALHQTFGGEARLGLTECLREDYPLLGLVQSGGHAGLYLLAHGAPARLTRWSALGRLLEQAWRHFGRVFLVVDATAHHAVGDAVRGRVLEAWWAGASGGVPRVALALGERLGITFRHYGLGDRMHATLETLEARVLELRAGAEQPAPEPADLPARPAPAAEPVAVARPQVLDCDLQVRERLRFLIWMRRVQAESRRETLVPAARA
jgi:hypothetical protein